MKKTKAKKEEIHNHYYQPNWSIVIKHLTICLIIFIFSITLISVFGAKITTKETVYNNCIDGCKMKSFIGLKFGQDTDINSCYVNEFDRTECIKACNYMYIALDNN